jgi:hypothetical protein
MLPDFFIVVFGEGVAVHTGGFDVISLAQHCQLLSKKGDCFFHVSAGFIQGFVMIADLMLARSNLIDYVRNIYLFLDPEIVGRCDAQFMLHSRQIQSISSIFIDIMAHNKQMSLLGIPF